MLAARVPDRVSLAADPMRICLTDSSRSCMSFVRPECIAVSRWVAIRPRPTNEAPCASCIRVCSIEAASMTVCSGLSRSLRQASLGRGRTLYSVPCSGQTAPAAASWLQRRVGFCAGAAAVACVPYVDKVHIMRTNIEIDDKLMKDALRATGAKTKKEAVELGLRTLLDLRAQEKARELRGKITWEGDLNAMRSDK